MNVYDFHKTIFHGDSTFRFFKFSLAKKPALVFRFFPVIVPFIKCRLGMGTKTAFKEKLYEGLFPKIDADAYLEEFWEKNMHLVKKFYLENQREDDIIISASPYFLIKPCCDKLGIKYLYASNVDKKTGKYDGINCHGKEKVRRFEQAGFKREDIEEFYSDAYSDTPLAALSKKAILVKGEKLLPWDEKELNSPKYKC